MATCPFCSDILLRHARAGQSYWLCRRCRTELIDCDSDHQVSPEICQEGGNESLPLAAHHPSFAKQSFIPSPRNLHRAGF